jgi:RecB family endonuclease NucS
MADLLIDPNIDAAKELIKKGLEKQKVILIVGNCVVDYRGRANSKLEEGERIIIIKEDRALLVHRPSGYEPVNWMPGPDIIYHVETVSTDEKRLSSRFPKTEKGLERSGSWQPPGCVFHFGVTDNTLQIRAVRQKPQESVRVSFDRVYMLSVLNLVDRGEFALHASEEDMQKAVLVMPSLIEDGLKPITYEKKVEPGFVDIYCEDKAGRLVVIEIKRKAANKQAALQLAKYVEAVRNIVNKNVRGVLAAPNLGKGVQRLLATLGLEFKPLDPRKCAEVLRKPETRRLQEFFKE